MHYTHTQTPFTIRRLTIRLFTQNFFLQVMDSQMNSELLNEMLEGNIISLSSGESNIDLLGPDFGLDPKEGLNTTKPYSIIDELMDGSPTHRTNQSQ